MDRDPDLDPNMQIISDPDLDLDPQQAFEYIFYEFSPFFLLCFAKSVKKYRYGNASSEKTDKAVWPKIAEMIGKSLGELLKKTVDQ